jgi:hypothetical protein
MALARAQRLDGAGQALGNAQRCADPSPESLELRREYKGAGWFPAATIFCAPVAAHFAVVAGDLPAAVAAGPGSAIVGGVETAPPNLAEAA